MKVLRFLLLLSVLPVFATATRAEAPPVFLLKWGTNGSGDGQFNLPRDIAVDASGNVYVADTVNHRIQKFGPAPVPVEPTTWGRVKAERR